MTWLVSLPITTLIAFTGGAMATMIFLHLLMIGFRFGTTHQTTARSIRQWIITIGWSMTTIGAALVATSLINNHTGPYSPVALLCFALLILSALGILASCTIQVIALRI